MMADTPLSGHVVVGGLHASRPHDSAHKHVSGEAVYTDDIREPRGLLYAAIGVSDRAHARVTKLDLTRVQAAPGVVAVITAKDIPGTNDIAPVAVGQISGFGEKSYTLALRAALDFLGK